MLNKIVKFIDSLFYQTVIVTTTVTTTTTINSTENEDIHVGLITHPVDTLPGLKYRNDGRYVYITDQNIKLSIPILVFHRPKLITESGAVRNDYHPQYTNAPFEICVNGAFGKHAYVDGTKLSRRAGYSSQSNQQIFNKIGGVRNLISKCQLIPQKEKYINLDIEMYLTNENIFLLITTDTADQIQLLQRNIGQFTQSTSGLQIAYAITRSILLAMYNSSVSSNNLENYNEDDLSVIIFYLIVQSLNQ